MPRDATGCRSSVVSRVRPVRSWYGALFGSERRAQRRLQSDGGEFDSFQARYGAFVQREDTRLAVSERRFDSRTLHGDVVQRQDATFAL